MWDRMRGVVKGSRHIMATTFTERLGFSNFNGGSGTNRREERSEGKPGNHKGERGVGLHHGSPRARPTEVLDVGLDVDLDVVDDVDVAPITMFVTTKGGRTMEEKKGIGKEMKKRRGESE